jgi:hypothetical protein
MEHRKSPRALRAAVATLPALVCRAAALLGCSQPRLAADWRETPLRNDGALDDWMGSGVRLGDTAARVLGPGVGPAGRGR